MSLELKGITKEVGAETHIYETDLVLKEGSFNVLLGTTLAGKTTLMRLMAGLDKPSNGEVWFKGQNVTGIPVQKRSVSMVYQQFINYPNMTVFDNIASPLKILNVSDAEIKARVGKLAELLKLSKMLDRLPKELSGGQQQRTAMARALIKNSELILLDEPLANLDYKLREELRDELPKIIEESGSTVVYATTEPTEALLLSGCTVAMHEGKVAEYGPALDIYRKPKYLTSAEVYSEPPINTAVIEKKGDHFIFNDTVNWPVKEAYKNISDGNYTLGVRPHNLSLQPNGGKQIKVNGLVKVVEISGSESMVHVSVDEHNWVSLSHGVHKFEIGEHVEMYIDIEDCLYFYKNGRRVSL